MPAGRGQGNDPHESPAASHPPHPEPWVSPAVYFLQEERSFWLIYQKAANLDKGAAPFNNQFTAAASTLGVIQDPEKLGKAAGNTLLPPPGSGVQANSRLDLDVCKRGRERQTTTIQSQQASLGCNNLARFLLGQICQRMGCGDLLPSSTAPDGTLEQHNGSPQAWSCVLVSRPSAISPKAFLNPCNGSQRFTRRFSNSSCTRCRRASCKAGSS